MHSLTDKFLAHLESCIFINKCKKELKFLPKMKFNEKNTEQKDWANSIDIIFTNQKNLENIKKVTWSWTGRLMFYK